MAIITTHFLKPTDSIIFKLRDKASRCNFTQYAVLPCNIEIAYYYDVISLYV